LLINAETLGAVEEDALEDWAADVLVWTCRWILDFVRVRPIDLFFEVIERVEE